MASFRDGPRYRWNRAAKRRARGNVGAPQPLVHMEERQQKLHEKRKRDAVSLRLASFYSRIKEGLAADSEQFFDRVMQQAGDRENPEHSHS